MNAIKIKAIQITRSHALTSVEHARTPLASRIESAPGYGVYVHANLQLSQMRIHLYRPVLQKIRSSDWVNIGLIAVRELEASEPELADALMCADYDFKNMQDR